MHCTNCGTLLPEGANNCPGCGMKIAELPGASQYTEVEENEVVESAGEGVDAERESTKAQEEQNSVETASASEIVAGNASQENEQSQQQVSTMQESVPALEAPKKKTKRTSPNWFQVLLNVIYP